MDMNIKFEWRDAATGLHILYVGQSKWGSASWTVPEPDQWQGYCYLTEEWGRDFPTLDEAKAWVEEQAREWLAEVTA